MWILLITTPLWMNTVKRYTKDIRNIEKTWSKERNDKTQLTKKTSFYKFKGRVKENTYEMSIYKKRWWYF